ncbi:hypothetical protein Yalta_165 [Yalta virus]|nr:hypothetical protein Yalta_165 [Yalta virus]
MFYKIFLLILIITIILLLFFYGDTVESSTDLNFNYDQLYYRNKILETNQVEDYINDQENIVPHLNPKQRKELIWFDKPNKTKHVIYYIHGFNGSKNEGRDVCIELAKDLEANLLLARLPGNGVFNKENSYKNITFYDHIRTVYEDLILSSLLGNNIILIGTSTGCTYSIIASTTFTNFNIIKTIFFSPNMGLHLMPSFVYEILSSGFGKHILNLASDKFKIDNYITSPQIFLSLSGALKAFQKKRNKFNKDFIIFISENDEWVSNRNVNYFFQNNNSNIKHYYILKNQTTHRILKLGQNNFFINKIKTFLNTNKKESLRQYIKTGV